MATATPTWTDNVSVIADSNLARGSTSRGTLDLRTKRGAWLFLGIGKQGTTALTNGVRVLVRRTLDNDGTIHPAPLADFTSIITAASSTTIDTDSNSGQAVVNVASESGFAAGQYFCIVDASFTPLRLEFHRVSKTASTEITADVNLKTTHTAAQADRVVNQADVWLLWLDGGAKYEVVFDYGDDSAGEAVTIRARAQSYDSDTVA